MTTPTPEGAYPQYPQYPQQVPAGYFAPGAPTAPPEPEADPQSTVERMRTEVDVENLPEGVIAVTLIPGDGDEPDVVVRVTSSLDWSATAMAAINSGNWNGWAAQCLYEDDYERVWLRVDPTNREVFAFLDEINRVSGQLLGESRASRRSSRRTARR